MRVKETPQEKKNEKKRKEKKKRKQNKTKENKKSLIVGGRTKNQSGSDRYDFTLCRSIRFVSNDFFFLSFFLKTFVCGSVRACVRV